MMFSDDDADDEERTARRPRTGPAAVLWGLVLVAAVALGGVGIWAVRAEVYSAESAAEGYRDALASGNGGEALGLLSETATEDLAERFEQTDPPTDAGLLSGEALEQSTEQLSDLTLEEDGAPALRFGYEGEQHSVNVPVDSGDTLWLIFDRWEITEEIISEFEVEVPQAGPAGVEQITVNGQPVDLENGSVRLAAFLPTAAHIEAGSPWVSGTVDHLVVDDSDATVQLDVEPSEQAEEQIREQIRSYLDSCAEQQVLMPSGCPMGAETPDQVDPETIEWTMPEVSELSVSFGEDGWQVEGTDSLTAELDFEAIDHFDGSSLEEHYEAEFSLEVEVEPVGDELRVSVSGTEGETAEE